MQGGIQMAQQVISLEALRTATNNFSAENVIGKGGSSIVYKGMLDGLPVAVKKITQAESEIISEEQDKQFEREIEGLFKVKHRNLVSMIGYHVSENLKILVLEFLKHDTLASRIHKWAIDGLRPLVWRERLSIALDVARGVEYLHSLANGTLIHRDLKASNILLGHDLTAKVADFGLMRSLPEGHASINTTWRGTYGYMAPEIGCIFSF